MVAETCGEIVLAVAAATVVVALLQSASPAAGLGVVYLPAVLEVAVRRGQWAGLAAAVLGVLTLNYLFIAPRHQLAIRHTQDLIALIVFLMAAVVVGRLAELGRARAREAESRARLAAAREQEATLLAEAASAILTGHSGQAQFTAIEKLVQTATGASRARIVAEPVPSPHDGEVTVRLRAQQRIWLYLTGDGSWGAPQLERIAGPLGTLLDLAAERERVAEQAAETEAARRTETARTAVLHAISHDLRSPLTAITTAISALRSDRVSVDEHGELVDVIDGESVRLAKLVDDLLDLSKIQAGAVAPRPDWCDLSDVVASAIAHLPDTQPIELDLPLDLPLVQAAAADAHRRGGRPGDGAGHRPGTGDSRPAARPGVRAVLSRTDRSQPRGGRRRVRPGTGDRQGLRRGQRRAHRPAVRDRPGHLVRRELPGGAPAGARRMSTEARAGGGPRILVVDSASST